MELMSVNIGRAEPIEKGKKSGVTGIFKRPLQASGTIGPEGLAGDVICDKQNHGGPDQAVYLYGTGDYAWWSAELGRELEPGTFGENLTIGGLESTQFNIGDRLHVGDVILEVTAPRIPCATLAARMGDPAFGKRYRAAERPGLYCRVIRAGNVQVGDPLTVGRYAGETVSALEMFRDFYLPALDEATIRRYLAAPVAIRDRERKAATLRERLAANLAAHTDGA
jgi:MOSC domain-containing protein YiiM